MEPKYVWYVSLVETIDYEGSNILEDFILEDEKDFLKLVTDKHLVINYKRDGIINVTTHETPYSNQTWWLERKEIVGSGTFKHYEIEKENWYDIVLADEHEESS